MGTDIKPIIITAVVLAFSTVVPARDYIPPPTGPYQSSVVINNSQTEDSTQQVYKFPPPDILMDDRRTDSRFSPFSPEPEMDEPQQYIPPTMVGSPLNQQQLPSAVNSQRRQPIPDSSANAYSPWQIPQGEQAGANNGWYGYQGGAPNYNQNVWQPAPVYGYQQQYPYSYGAPNQYNGANTPFNGMPSPWNVMPKNPFFSDK